ncbi:MAG: primosomal protein N', partial [Pseudomonadota bacterium]
PHENIVSLHSGLTAKQRCQAFLQAQTGAAKLIIGTRSAIFTSMPNLGIIIIDEEHDASFKQQDGLRYHARDIAIMRAQYLKIQIILGSASPSLETYANVAHGKYQCLSLPHRATQAKLPQMHLIDTNHQATTAGLSSPLINEIKKTLTKEQQILLFLNRRGFAPTLYCNSCGFIAECRRCDAKLIYHKTKNKLICHHCLAQHNVLEICPQCQLTSLIPLSFGTQRIEESLKKHFPEYDILRIDKDVMRSQQDWDKLINQLEAGKPCIMIGTQMLAKGHHFPNIALVGILDCDYGFYAADLRASERMGQLVLQVAGRAGRGEVPGIVLIQTNMPENPLWQPLLAHDYDAFAKILLQQRQQHHLPPYSYHALLRVEAKRTDKIKEFFAKLLHQCEKLTNITLLGPIDALMAKKAGFFRSQLLLQADNRKYLQNYLEHFTKMILTIKIAKEVRWHIDIDPQDFY